VTVHRGLNMPARGPYSLRGLRNITQKKKVKVMQENDFDKKVKAAMDEFRLRPSEPVWPTIYDQIRDKKRRRILLLFPVFLVLMALGYFTWNAGYLSPKTYSSNKELLTNKNTTAKNSTAPNGQPPQGDAAVSTTDSPLDRSTATAETKGSTKAKEHTDKQPPAENDITTSVSNTSRLVKNNKAGRDFQKKETKQNIATHKDNDWSLTLKQPSEKNNLSGINQSLRDVIVNTATLKKMTPDNTPVLTESDSTFAMKNTIRDGKVLLQGLPIITGIRDNGKIKWGLDLALGGSSRADKPFKRVSTEKAFARDYIGGGGSTSNVTGGLLVVPPSNIKPGVAFKIGVLADKSISRRLRVSAGLRYAYISEHITIGKVIYPTSNTLALQGLSYSTYPVAQAAYGGTQSQDFTNKYHFIELPVSGHFLITPNWRAPFVWDAGVSLSRLISSNMLLYDNAWGGVYYKGKNNLSKTQFGVSTGFSLRLKSKSQWQWDIGPHISLNTTKLFQSTSDKNKHIVYGSMNLRLLFPGKKK